MLSLRQGRLEGKKPTSIPSTPRCTCRARACGEGFATTHGQRRDCEHGSPTDDRAFDTGHRCKSCIFTRDLRYRNQVPREEHVQDERAREKDVPKRACYVENAEFGRRQPCGCEIKNREVCRKRWKQETKQDDGPAKDRIVVIPPQELFQPRPVRNIESPMRLLSLASAFHVPPPTSTGPPPCRR